MRKIQTLCIPLKKDRVLLGMKKRGFGFNMWNGFGGKVEEGEDIEIATRRELYEEAGIQDGLLSKAGMMEFSFIGEKTILQVHIFRLSNFFDEPIETEEMRPQWFDFKEIPFSKMWPDDKYWFPLFLENRLFDGEFLFEKPSDSNYSAKIISKRLDEVSFLN